jgi:Flp pilus assembly protein TadB
VSALSLIAAAAGAAVVAGLLLIVAGLRPAPARPTRPPRRRSRAQQLGLAGGTAGQRSPALWAAAAVVGVLTLLVTRWPVAAIGMAAATVGVPPLLVDRAVQRQIARLEALAEWTRRLADILSSGAGGLEQAIQMSTRTCPPAIAAEVEALAARLRPRGTVGALRAFADDLADPTADLVAAALILRVEKGSRGLRAVLEGLAADVADRVRMRRGVEADRAKPRSNVRSLTVITFTVVVITLIFARDYLAPFGTLLGQLVLTLIVMLFVFSFWWLWRIAQPKVGGRFLPPDQPGATSRPVSARSAAPVAATENGRSSR